MMVFSKVKYGTVCCCSSWVRLYLSDNNNKSLTCFSCFSVLLFHTDMHASKLTINLAYKYVIIHLNVK